MTSLCCDGAGCFSFAFYSVIFVWQRLLLPVLTAIYQYVWIDRKLYIEPDTFEPRSCRLWSSIPASPFYPTDKTEQMKCACLSKHRNFFNVKWYWIRTHYTLSFIIIGNSCRIHNTYIDCGVFFRFLLLCFLLFFFRSVAFLVSMEWRSLLIILTTFHTPANSFAELLVVASVVRALAIHKNSCGTRTSSAATMYEYVLNSSEIIMSAVWQSL